MKGNPTDALRLLGQKNAEIAQLIADKMELLEALEACASVCAGETLSKNALINALEKACAALKKAKGE